MLYGMIPVLFIATGEISVSNIVQFAGLNVFTAREREGLLSWLAANPEFSYWELHQDDEGRDILSLWDNREGDGDCALTIFKVRGEVTATSDFRRALHRGRSLGAVLEAISGVKETA
jgi:hypothetical protein